MKDSKLDLINAIHKYYLEAKETESILMICHDLEDGSTINFNEGNMEWISLFISDIEYANAKTKEEIERYIELQKTILRFSLNICNKNREYVLPFLKALTDLK